MRKHFARNALILLVALFAVVSLPHVAFAHEVYVLTPSQIAHNLEVNSLNVFTALTLPGAMAWFLFFAFTAITTLTISFIISFSRWGVLTAKKIEKFSDVALPLIRIVFGVSLIFSAYYHSLFGPELPLASLFGGTVWTNVLYLAGALVIVGLFTRVVSLILLFIFFLSIFAFHEYMLTYSNYFGEMLVLLLIGGEKFSLDSLLFKKWHLPLFKNPQKIAIPILRISFALSLLYAALYVKFLHPALAYQVVLRYHLDKFFPFDPLFVVLGAGCVEVVIALLFLFGINMRWNILFFTFWATLSLFFFGEAVWPHYLLFGISAGLFLYGYDRLTLEKWLITKTKKLFIK